MTAPAGLRHHAVPAGTEKERLAFMYAVKKHYSSVEEEEEDTDGLSVEDNTDVPARPKLSLLFKEVRK